MENYENENNHNDEQQVMIESITFSQIFNSFYNFPMRSFFPRRLRYDPITNRRPLTLAPLRINNDSGSHDVEAIHLQRGQRRLWRISSEPLITQNVSLNSEYSSSVYSMSENSQQQYCRICRCTRSQELVSCPCKCSGSVGYIHLDCLRRWIRFKRDNRCEICKNIFNVPSEPRNYKKLFSNFFRRKYLGVILQYITSLVTLTPLVYYSITQVVHAVESIKFQDKTMKLSIVGPAMVMTTSIYFFLYFEWAVATLKKIEKVLLYWWTFGDQDEDTESFILDNYTFRDFTF